MTRTLLVALAALGLAGCGGDEPAGEDAAGVQCGSSTPLVRARDLTRQLPASYRTTRGDRKAIAAVTKQVEGPLGENLRGSDALVVVRRGETQGAAVIVFNLDQQAEPEGIIAGVDGRAEEADLATEPLDVVGGPGRLVEAVDGGQVAIGAAGDCAAVVVAGASRGTVRTITGFLRK